MERRHLWRIRLWLCALSADIEVTRHPVAAHVASFNTRLATELCIRSMRETAAHPLEVHVGDCGSTDGSLDMLRSFEQRGWVHLEVAASGRSHADWLDRWLAGSDARYTLFADSDMRFRREGWLASMVETAESTGAMAVCGELVPEVANYVAHDGDRMRLAPRFSPWLVLLDTVRTRELGVSFAFEWSRRPDLPEGALSFDVGARLYEAMPPGACVEIHARHRDSWRHAGGLSWDRRGFKRRVVALGAYASIWRSLVELRMRQG